MFTLSSVASNLSNVTKHALDGALRPVRSAGAVGRLIRKGRVKPGSAPGSLLHIGPPKVEKVRIRLFEYDAEELEEKRQKRLEAIRLREMQRKQNLAGPHFGEKPLHKKYVYLRCVFSSSLDSL